jgi:hypothetical protein
MREAAVVLEGAALRVERPVGNPEESVSGIASTMAEWTVARVGRH